MPERDDHAELLEYTREQYAAPVKERITPAKQEADSQPEAETEAERPEPLPTDPDNPDTRPTDSL